MHIYHVHYVTLLSNEFEENLIWGFHCNLYVDNQGNAIFAVMLSSTLFSVHEATVN